MPREKPRSGRTTPTKDGSALSEGGEDRPHGSSREAAIQGPPGPGSGPSVRAHASATPVQRRSRACANLTCPARGVSSTGLWLGRLACDLSDTRGSSKLIKQSSDTRTSNGLRRIAPIPQNVRRIHLIHLRDQPSLLSRCLMKLRAIGLRIHNPFTEPCQNVAEPYDDLARR
jgi:hypothetical protein